MDHTVGSDSTSDIDAQTKTWESDPRPLSQRMAEDLTKPQTGCGIGHRVQASRSVLALVLDDECVFAGLQGGDIVVRMLCYTCLLAMTHWNRLGRSTLMISFSPYMHTRRVSWVFICQRMEIYCFPAVVIRSSMYSSHPNPMETANDCARYGPRKRLNGCILSTPTMTSAIYLPSPIHRV